VHGRYRVYGPGVSGVSGDVRNRGRDLAVAAGAALRVSQIVGGATFTALCGAQLRARLTTTMGAPEYKTVEARIPPTVYAHKSRED